MIQLFINIILTTSLLLIIANSFILIYYPTGFFHIAHAIIICFGAYFTFMFFQQFNFPFLLSILLAILLSTLMGILIGISLYKPLHRKNKTPFLLLIASLGVYVVLQNCISLIWGDDIKSLRTGEINIGNDFFGAYITNIQIITVIVSFSVYIISSLFLKYHKVGRNIRAFASNEELANVFGINSNKVILWSFGIGSGIASIVGILVASDTGLTPTMGFNLLLYGIVVIIIGGLGSTWWLIGSAFLLASAQHFTAYYIDSKWMDAITYIILILFLIWKPLGFSGKRLKKTEI
jgi:branched-chain amino acid transport system permease protein